VHRQWLEFWYAPPGCALTDEELEFLRRIAASEAPVLFQAEGRPVPAYAEPGNRGHARRRCSAAQAYCTESGREVLEMIGG
jgi:hypothetical protein